MDDTQFQNFLKSLSGLKTTATNTQPKNDVARGAFGLPLDKQPVVKKEQTLTGADNPVGSLPVIKQLTQFGVGLGTQVGKAGIGLGQTFLKGANVISNIMGNPKDQYNPIIKTMEDIKTGIFEDPYKKELSSFAGKAGQLTGDVAVFAEGNAPITKGQQFLSGAEKGLNISNKIINYGLKKTAQIVPEAIGMGGIQYATSGGDAKEAGTVGVVSGVLSGLTHVGADVFRTLIPQTIKDSVAKIFVPRGKIKLGGTENITDDAVGALQTIKNLAPDIKVVDANGIEKAFVPEKATLLEMPQVLLQAKDKIYKAYSDLATKAGDAGANFGQADFNSVISDLSKYEGKGYTQSFSNKAKQIQEALNRYGTLNPKDGKFYFTNTAPDEIQTLIEAINRDVNPLSDKAGAEVSLDVSRKLREILDNKITNATGEGYQVLRDSYKQLKSIEPTIINEFKKSLRGQGIQADIIDKIATVDTITGLLSGNPVAVARGATWEAVKIAWRKALGNEANLQRAFKLMNKADKEVPALAQRIYANPAETGIFKAGEKAVTDIKAIPNKEGGFISLGGKEFPALNEVKVPNASEGTSINVGLKTNVGGDITDQEVKDVLKKEFNVDVVEGAVHQSGTEPTFTAKLSRPLTDEELYKLTETLKQDAIPQLSNGVGKMTNIGKESWGDFNPEYFMDNTGKPIGATPVANPSLRTGQPEIGKVNEDLVARERFDIPKLKKISFGGSDRDVYDLGDGKVLKVAKNSRGLDQNVSSVDYYAEDNGLTPKTYEQGKNYVVKEKVLPPDKQTKAMLKDIQKLPFDKQSNEFYTELAKLDEKYGNEGLGLYSFSDIGNYNILVGDFKATRNWGTTVEGKPILLDEGTLNGDLIKNSTVGKGGTNMLDPEFRKVYNQSREAKKKWGDIDKKTMYGILATIGIGVSAKKK